MSFARHFTPVSKRMDCPDRTRRSRRTAKFKSALNLGANEIHSISARCRSAVDRSVADIPFTLFGALWAGSKNGVLANGVILRHCSVGLAGAQKQLRHPTTVQ